MSPPAPREPDRRFAVVGGALLALATGLSVGAPTLTGRTAEGAPIPAFSRMYGTACSTCHAAPPKLNVLGEAFRLNGYRMPESQLLVRRDDPVSLGAPEWDEAWPRTIRSSDLPGIVPLALRIVSDAEITRDERKPYDATYRFPHEIHVLAGAPLGEDVAVFLDTGWSPEEGFEVSQAKVEFQDVVPFLPPRALNLWVGLQNPYLLTLADHHIDRAGRQPFSWQTFDADGLEWMPPDGDAPLQATALPALGRSQAAVEANGLLGGRLYYGVGLSQGLQDGPTDANRRKDVYYKVRYKLGGLDLAGRYEDGEEPSSPVHSQLLDRALVLEHFGYFGSETTGEAPVGDHEAFGATARALLDRLDLGVGYVFRAFEGPWPDFAAGSVEATSFFAKAEYIVLPWVLGSLKAERFDVDPDGLPSGGAVAPAEDDATRVMPGVILLLRQNVRLVAEGELFLRSPETDRSDLRRPHGLWLRLDVAF